MIDIDEAAQIAAHYLNEKLNLEDGDEVIITHGEEHGDWWVFQYDSRLYRQTGNLLYAIVEGHPIAVHKSDGSIG